MKQNIDIGDWIIKGMMLVFLVSIFIWDENRDQVNLKNDIRILDTYITYDDRSVTVYSIYCPSNPPYKYCNIKYYYSDEDTDWLREDRFWAMIKKRINRFNEV